MKKKECFGTLEQVFPMGDKGLREVPAECFECPDHTECLRAAMDTPDGIEMRQETVDRAAQAGMMGRLQRWSRKKELDRQAREKKKRKRS